jgi:hypothetical protein
MNYLYHIAMEIIKIGSAQGAPNYWQLRVLTASILSDEYADSK